MQAVREPPRSNESRRSLEGEKKYISEESDKAVLRPAPHIGRKGMQHQQNTATAEGAQSHRGGGLRQQ